MGTAQRLSLGPSLWSNGCPWDGRTAESDAYNTYMRMGSMQWMDVRLLIFRLSIAEESLGIRSVQSSSLLLYKCRISVVASHRGGRLLLSEYSRTSEGARMRYIIFIYALSAVIGIFAHDAVATAAPAVSRGKDTKT